MPSVINVAIHSSQFPDQVRRDLLESLRTREINHRFHYESSKQAQKWLALHQQYSPSHNDDDCLRSYDSGFEAAASQMRGKGIQLTGLCCGDGRKEARLIRFLARAGKDVSYVPCDGSIPLVLLARDAAAKQIEPRNCHPFVCDLRAATDLPDCFTRMSPSRARRLVTFFGTLHNFEPSLIFPRLAALLRPGDLLLASANLAPAGDYEAGVRGILPQYRNPPTVDWLREFVIDVGIPLTAGKMDVAIEADSAEKKLRRIAVRFKFTKSVALKLAGAEFAFRKGESLRLFYSYRYSPAIATELFHRHGLRVLGHWCGQSEQEGIFLCGR